MNCVFNLVSNVPNTKRLVGLSSTISTYFVSSYIAFTCVVALSGITLLLEEEHDPFKTGNVRVWFISLHSDLLNEKVR